MNFIRLSFVTQIGKNILPTDVSDVCDFSGCSSVLHVASWVFLGVILRFWLLFWWRSDLGLHYYDLIQYQVLQFQLSLALLHSSCHSHQDWWCQDCLLPRPGFNDRSIWCGRWADVVQNTYKNLKLQYWYKL